MNEEEELWHVAIRKFAASYNKNPVGYFESLAEIYEEVDPFRARCARENAKSWRKREEREKRSQTQNV